MRAGQKARHDIAEHHRLFHPLEQHRHHGAEYKDESQIADQAFDRERFGGYGG